MRATKVLFWLAQLAGVAVTIGLLWFHDLPLGIPGEWVWDRIDFDAASFQETSLGWVIAGCATVVYLLFCLFADRRVLEASRWEMTAWLSGLILMGVIWHGIAQECPPDPNRLSKVPWVLWYPGTQGYYAEARGRASQEPDYLAKYLDRMKEGDVLHFGTHPPGFIQWHKSIISLTQRSPMVQGWFLDYQPQSVRESLNELAKNTANSPMPVQEVDRAALWLSGVLAAFAAISTVVPIYFLIRRSCGRETAWRLVCLWPMVPALAVFHPVSDLWLPVFGATFLALWCEAWSQRSFLLAILSGLVMSFGMRLSLAMLPVAFLAALWTITDCLFAEATEPLKARLKNLGLCVFASLAPFLLLVLSARYFDSLDLPEVWLQNLKNHAAFYDKFSRSSSKWMLVNPIELAMAVGSPIFVMALSRWLAGTRGCLKSARSLASFRFACLVTIGILWLSGKNSGEAARLWIFLMPWLLWVAGHEEEISAKIVNGPGQTLPEYTGTPARGWIALMIFQAVVCIATVSRVDGFHWKTTVPLPEATPNVNSNSSARIRHGDLGTGWAINFQPGGFRDR